MKDDATKLGFIWTQTASYLSRSWTRPTLSSGYRVAPASDCNAHDNEYHQQWKVGAVVSFSFTLYNSTKPDDRLKRDVTGRSRNNRSIHQTLSELGIKENEGKDAGIKINPTLFRKNTTSPKQEENKWDPDCVCEPALAAFETTAAINKICFQHLQLKQFSISRQCQRR